MKQVVLLFLLLLTTTFVFSQNMNSISGKLIDEEYNNNPLAYGTVSIKGSVNQTTSNLEGEYVFKNLKPGKYILVFSFVGYKTKEKHVTLINKEATTVNVSMGALKPSLNNTTVSNYTSSKAKLTSS